MIVSQVVFVWIATVAVAGVASVWALRDLLELRRFLRVRAPRAPEIRDRIFGSLVGVALGAIAMIGVVLHHLR